MKERRKVLIIDDEVDFTFMLQFALEEAGDYEVYVANDCTTGLLSASIFQPDLILLDVVMPDSEGADMFNFIRSLENFKEIPIAFLTATVTRDEVHQAKGFIGGQRFFAKPCCIKEIVDFIDTSATYNC